MELPARMGAVITDQGADGRLVLALIPVDGDAIALNINIVRQQ